MSEGEEQTSARAPTPHLKMAEAQRESLAVFMDDRLKKVLPKLLHNETGYIYRK